MSKIKISELFYSIQGEGRYTGVPSIFLRTFGCNFTCGGFGMPKGQLSNEADMIALKAKEYTDFDDLPLVTTGCDSYASWHPAFKHLSKFMTTDEVTEAIMRLLPNNVWEDQHLVITGGEPLLGWQRVYPELLSHPKMHRLSEITFETNGTQPLSEEFFNYLEDWWHEGGKKGFGSDNYGREITFSVSPKLTCSGHTREEAIKSDIINQYQKVGYTYLKFVVATEEDINEAVENVKIYRDNGFTGPVYLMPVGGVQEVYDLNKENVAVAALKLGYRYSDRLHIGLFGNQWGT